MIQTSYFSGKAPQGRKVSIAKWPPRGWKGPRANRLAPSNPKAENWRECYLKDLAERFPEGKGLREYLDEIAVRTPEPILCCYEADPEQCHRRVLAEYAKIWLGMDMPEWSAPARGQASLL